MHKKKRKKPSSREINRRILQSFENFNFSEAYGVYGSRLREIHAQNPGITKTTALQKLALQLGKEAQHVKSESDQS